MAVKSANALARVEPDVKEQAEAILSKLPVKSYLVYFWIDEHAKKVQVTAIIYGRRDQKQTLS